MTPSSNPWSAWDAQRSAALTSAAGPTGPRRLAFYGRCSTEDLQDPETSRRWQLDRAKALLAAVDPTAEIVAAFFDIGLSRSVPWKRRPEAMRLLAELDSPTRGWDGIVVGEGKRCWFGPQFTEVAPIVMDRGVDLFVPELSGRYDPKNASHYTLMTVNGGMSLSERQSVQERVRAAMRVQVESQGRRQGGRPPYGYALEAYAPHPNQEKARQGIMLKRLSPDPAAAEVVRRIFADALAGKSASQIAADLNRDGVPSPSVQDPDGHHPRATPYWVAGTITSMLRNARYTGYEVWGRKTRTETLIDPNDPSWGNRVKKVDNVGGATRSQVPSHEALVSVEDWQRVNDLLDAKAAVYRTRRADKVEPEARNRTSRTTRSYAFRGLLTCACCGRKMSGETFGSAKPAKAIEPGKPRRGRPPKPRTASTGVRYACRRPRETNGTRFFEGHPMGVTLAESKFHGLVAEWLATYLTPQNREQTLDLLVAANSVPNLSAARAVRQRDRSGETKAALNRLLDLVEQGTVDLATVQPRIERLQAELRAQEVSTVAAPPTPDVTALPTRERIAAMLDALADVADEVFGSDADPKALNDFFRAIRLTLSWDVETRTLRAQAFGPADHGGVPWGLSTCPRWGSNPH